MKLKHLIASVAMTVAAASSSAAVINTFDVNLSPLGAGTYAALFNNTVTCSGGCDFIDTYLFHPDLNGIVDSFIGTLGFGAADIDFTSVTLNGQSYMVTPDMPILNNLQVAALFDTYTTAPLSLVVMGHSGGNGDYFGMLTMRNASAVPEPGTLALLGLAGIGLASVRRRKDAKGATTKRFSSHRSFA